MQNTRLLPRPRILPGLLLGTLLCLSALLPVQALAATDIAILLDGRSSSYDSYVTLFEKEITDLTEGEFDIRFETYAPESGDWTYQSISAKYDELQRSGKVDMVVTLGFVSSLVAAYDSAPRKPTFAPYVIDINFPNLPRKGVGSGVRNLNYLADEVALKQDMERFQSVVDASSSVVLVDDSIFQAIEDLPRRIQAVGEQIGIATSFIRHSGGSANELLARIPDNTDVAVIADLPRLSEGEMQRLIDGLNQRKIASYSVVHPQLVERGALMATESQDDDRRRARITALNIQSTLLGENPSRFNVVFTPKENLVINMRTARAIELYPRYDLLSQATLLYEDQVGEEPMLSLQDVAHEAIRANLNLIASRLGVEAGEQDVRVTRSALFPQITLEGATSRRRDDSLYVTSGSFAEGTTSAQISLSQVLYSESVRAAHDVQKLQQLSTEAQHRALELDVVQQATVAFLNLLRAQTQVEINRSQLNLSSANLELAQNRLQVGSANAADVYRWEAQIATDRQNVLQARASLGQAREALNNILHRPIGTVFKTTPATLEHDEVLFSNSELQQLIDNQRDLALLQDLYIQIGQQTSPELAQNDLQVAIARRQLTAGRRSYYVPDLSLTGNASQIIDEDRSYGASFEDEDDWSISLNLSLPLYSGGQRRANVSKADLQLRQSEVLREQTLRDIEQNVRQYFHEINASFPSIELSQLAADSSSKNYDLIQDSYIQGVAGVADLIDAQSAAITAEQNAANAVYDFLIDLMNLQRSIGAFDYFLDEPSRQQRIDLIKQYVQNGE